jgi:hypothetical protein
MCESATFCAQFRLVTRHFTAIVDDSRFVFIIKLIVVTQNKPDALASGPTRPEPHNATFWRRRAVHVDSATTLAGANLEYWGVAVRTHFVSSQMHMRALRREARESSLSCPQEEVITSRQRCCSIRFRQ